MAVSREHAVFFCVWYGQNHGVSFLSRASSYLSPHRALMKFLQLWSANQTLQENSASQSKVKPGKDIRRGDLPLNPLSTVELNQSLREFTQLLVLCRR